ncbi:serine/threonine-protein kinase [Pyxidicoccus sp. MSG2]|uniref:serine/threonine-protein kinase n=1 Tax=Pyxidicoccus sp. MSG2 TaxID=2996790 RepID=UPI00226DE587|nr:serine/threonine-protein kinase [Pyxidicoccus sp. MSG2]MCY1021432.1 protein kinase [Pyxidicoccus sp. MSG2]
MPASGKGERPRGPTAADGSRREILPTVSVAAEKGSQEAETPATPPAPDADEALPLSNWERYELLGRLGRGGMGDVYKARDRRLGRLVALKFIRGDDPRRARRLLQEARALARIDHPNVCRVLETGEVGEKAYIAMQLVDGQRLDHASAGMSPHEKVQVMREVAAAVHEAHRLGLIHRDLKPANIMVTREDDGRCVPMVMDFGLAHELSQEHGLTESGALLGTPAYMAPEQARGDVPAIDRRSDVYSLGATLYELLGGMPPFVGATVAGTLAKVLHEEPPPLRARVPSLAVELETITLKCLSKDPGQRYPSARALAEDLGRYIDGEPILGQRPGLLYRLRQRARKHRSLVAVSAVSLASILVLAIVGVRSGLRARHAEQQSASRALLAGQLGQQMKEIEWFLRAAYMMPLHDSQREQQLVRERMAQISALPHELGAQGEGAVHYALGRGHLAMHELEQALQELTRAQEQGMDSRELHYARGRVLGELYHQALEDARRKGGGEWVAERQRVLERRFLVPALESLERSRGLQLESPRYLEGLIALYRRQYDAAARAAALASEEAPWMYEARKLAGDVAHAQAMEQLERGEYDAARATFQRALGLYEQALAQGRSDVRNYEALAEVWLQLAELDKRQGRSRKEALEKALALGDQVLQAAPRRARGYTKKAWLLMHWYRLMNFQEGGQDPKPILADWIATAAQAAKLDPGDVQAYDTLGYGHFMRGLQDAREGREPNPAWDEAITWLTRALELEPDYPWGLNDLALVFRWRGNHQREHGQDPREAYAQAARHLEQAVRSDPKYLFAHSNLADLSTAAAAYLLSRGLDPGAELQKAREAGARALALDGNFYSALNHVALAELLHARHLLAVGADPREVLERASHHLARSKSINPAFGRTYLYLAMGHELEAVHALMERGEPGSELAAGRQALQEAYRYDSRCADCHIAGARLGLVEATWAARRGRSPVPVLQQALTEARRAVALYPYFEAHQELARVCWRLSEAQPAAQALPAITEGLAQVDLALRLAPDLAEAHAVRGGLLLGRARTLPGAAERLELIRQARAALARAFELNPLLRREYEALVRDTQALASGP